MYLSALSGPTDWINSYVFVGNNCALATLYSQPLLLCESGVTKHFYIREAVSIDRQCHVNNAVLTISVLQACCAVTTEYGIPSNSIKKSTASLQIEISTAQLNFSNRNVIIF